MNSSTMHYSNKIGYIEYSSSTSHYLLNIYGKSFSLQFCEFHNMKEKLKSINIEELLYNLEDQADYTDFKFFKLQKSLTLNLAGVINLKELVEGFIFELHIEDVLYRAGIDKPQIEETVLLNL